jgi:hypothetical protein
MVVVETFNYKILFRLLQVQRFRYLQRQLQKRILDMAALGSVLYDPSVAVTKATTSLLAMTVFDATNLRITFTVPSSGRVMVRIQCIVHGATTLPQILLGVMNGSAVVGRVAPFYSGGNLAATSLVTAEAMFVVSGLSPAASLTWDAAYGVETLVASTGIKYGGPNNATGNDAFGAFSYEVWSA